MPEYYNNIQGWFNFPQFYWTVANNLPHNFKIAEIGVWKGTSACFMAESIKELGKIGRFYCIDTWTGVTGEGQDEYKEDNYGKTYKEFLTNMKNGKVLDYVIPIIMDSAESASIFEDSSFDFIFIDATHQYEQFKRDAMAWVNKVKVGGIFSGHDYDENIKRALTEMGIQFNCSTFYPCWYSIKK